MNPPSPVIATFLISWRLFEKLLGQLENKKVEMHGFVFQHHSAKEYFYFQHCYSDGRRQSQLCVSAEGYILVKNNFKIAHSSTGGHGTIR